jgi:ADP-ribosylation factor-like protein 13B
MSDPRVLYCREHNVHHLFELLAAKLLAERPSNPFAYLRSELEGIEDSEKRKGEYDPTQVKVSDELRNVTLAMLGLDNAGKTALLAAMGGEHDENTTPTVGFDPKAFQTDTHSIKIFDLGGGGNFRGIWHHYFHDCHGFFFVIDASDASKFEEAAVCLKDIVSHPYMNGKPIVIVVNKVDLLKDVDAQVSSVLKSINVTPESLSAKFTVIKTCAIRSDDSANDQEIESGIEWMIGAVDADYQKLAQRVVDDTARIKEEKKKRLAAL